jgi:two-component system sensor histidine kinase BaeS
LVISALLARHLLKPVNALAKGTAKLATGNFAVRLRTDSKDELGRLAMDFNSLAQALERAETLRRQWVADISHELRTPLSILRGEVEALQDGVRECSRVTLRSLHVEILHLSKIVDDLYTLALSDIGSLNYAREIVDIEELIQSIVSGFRTKLDNKKIMLRYEPDAEKFVYADRQRLGQLFRNIVENTLRYTDAPGKLVIRTEANKEFVIVHFEDSAPGVPETELEHLFERFSRVEMSRNRESGGAGLGLAICRKIVEAHEGEISAQQSELGGLHIKIRLPASSGMA